MPKSYKSIGAFIRASNQKRGLTFWVTVYTLN